MPKRFICKAKQRVRLLKLIPPNASWAMEHEQMRQATYNETPQEIKEFIKSEFSDPREADCIMYAFVKNAHARIVILDLHDSKKSRIEKLSDLRVY